MRLVAYTPQNVANDMERWIGRVTGDMIAPIADIDRFYANVATHLALAAREDRPLLALSDVRLAPPVPRDAKIVCTAINYVKHGAESKLPTPEFPNLFARWASELVVDGDSVPVPAAETDGLDWEVELAAIVGKRVVDASLEEAQAAILGFTVANDISARGAQRQAMSLSTGQWALGKNPDKSAAIGSFVETADAVDERSLAISAVVDGATVQQASTADMVFSTADLIAFISRQVTLRPGDLILTGTPEGTGFGLTPPRYMKPGSLVTVSVAGICSITNHIVDHHGRLKSR